MQKKTGFTLLTFSVIFSLALISGCGNGPEDATGSAVASVCNAPYFEFKAGECCLDQNSNSICDSDETAVKEETTTETVTKSDEVEITLSDSCTDTTYFACDASYITKDEIFFKLETKSRTGPGFLHLQGISALGCEKEFLEKSKAIEGYPIGTEILVSLPCVKFSAGEEVEDAEYTLEYIFYPDEGFINAQTGEWEGTTRNLQKSSGQISGTVRNEPKKIL